MDDAEPLSDAQAEAVLLVLADPLVWRNGLGRRRERELASCKGGCYQVSDKDSGWDATMMPTIDILAVPASWRQSINRAPQHYTSCVDAKAACERHHATGKWE